jgi:hypothetical protein
MEIKKEIITSCSDFKKLVSDYYYVDKTLLIRDLFNRRENVREMVTVITRPRRFGKSVNLSMLQCFFDIKEDSAELFSDLKIAGYPDIIRDRQNRYPIIYLDLKDFDVRNIVAFENRLYSKILGAISPHKADIERLADHSSVEYGKFDEIVSKKVPIDTAVEILKVLSVLLYEIHGARPVILIDEYDAPLTLAYDTDYFGDALKLIKGILGPGLKGNNFLELAVVTGCTYITKNNIFSDVNNLAVYTIMDDGFDGYYGFTEEEVRSALDYFDLSDRFEEVARWYDGYRFGKTTIYNPWSIANFLKKRDTGTYWIGTGSDSLINSIFKQTYAGQSPSYIQLLDGQPITVTISDSITFRRLTKSADNLFTLLYHAGYLKGIGEVRLFQPSVLQLVNYEVEQSFRYIFESTSKEYFDDFTNARDFLEALLDLDVEKMKQSLDACIGNIASQDFELTYG